MEGSKKKLWEAIHKLAGCISYRDPHCPVRFKTLFDGLRLALRLPGKPT